MKTSNLKRTFFILAFIAIGQVVWWAYLLVSQQYELVNLINTDQALYHADKFKFMVVSEGLFFFVVWGLAIWSAYQSSMKEAELRKAHSNFMSAVTHELKTPLANIRLALETLERPNLSTDQIAKYIGRGQQAVDRLLDEIETILKISNTTHIENRPTHFSLAHVIDTSLALFAPEYLQHFEIQKDLDPTLAVFAPLDESRLIIRNLIDNALKYSSEELSSESKKPVIKIHVERTSGQRVLLSIRDYGFGLDKSDLGKIFEPFWRASQVVKMSKPGTGLGLTFAKRFSDHSGLKLWLTSEGLGHGTTAFLEFKAGQLP